MILIQCWWIQLKIPATVPEEVGEVPAGISGVVSVAEEAGAWGVDPVESLLDLGDQKNALILEKLQFNPSKFTKV